MFYYNQISAMLNMANPNYLFGFVGILIFLTVLPSQATMYTVGDSAGWDISTDLDSWSTGKKLVVGDVLVFQYSTPFSACELTSKEYDTCNTNDAVKRLTSGNATVTLTKPGDLYFADCNSLYCLGGMKMKIHVQPNSTAAAGPPIGAPETAPGPAGLLPRTSKTNNPTLTSSAQFIKIGHPFYLFFLIGFIIRCII